MFRALRLLISTFALAGMLVAGGGVAAKAHHDCAGMAAGMSMDDCPGGHEGGAAAPDCASFVCAAAQIVLPPLPVVLSFIRPTFATPPPPPNDSDPGGLSRSPDLRPPIA
jgi:hypothetical protein